MQNIKLLYLVLQLDKKKQKHKEKNLKIVKLKIFNKLSL